MRNLQVRRVRRVLETLAVPIALLSSYSASFAQQRPITTPAGSPMKMRLCIGTPCENLIWSGSYYDSVKDNNPAILNHYTVMQWSPQAIRLESRSVAPLKVEEQVIYGNIKRRKEIFGQGIFTGAISAEGNSIENGKLSWQAGQLKGESTFTLTWDAEPSSTVAAACSGGPANSPPPVVLLICDGPCLKNSDRGDLGTWIFSGSTGNGDWGRGAKAYLTLQEWSEGRVTITREDKADSLYPGFSAIYRGTVCGEKVKGMESAEWPGHWQGKISGPWTADIPITSCDRVPNDDVMRLTQTAQQSIRFRQLTSAFDCLTRAANLGDRDARTAVGIMYRDGVGTKVSYPDALRYLKQSAIQDEYNAEVALSQMYDIGVGVPASPVQAQEWARRARQNPLYVQAVRNRQVEDDNRHMAFLGLTALVEAMATPSVYVVR